MSAEPTNEWKVGAFVVGGVAAAVASLFWLGASRFDTEVVERVTYLDESVQGLEIGAPVKIRGVTIGKVSDIRLAPDRRLVEVHADLRVDALQRINAISSGQVVLESAGEVSPEIRVTVAAQGITGIKFLEVDFFPEGTPVIELTFDPPENYIASAPSTLKGLEDALRSVGDELPAVVRDLGTLVNTLDDTLTNLDTARLSESVSELAETITAAIDGTATTGFGPELLALVKELRTTVRNLDGAITSLSEDGGWADRGVVSFESVATEIREAVENLDRLVEASDLPGTTESIRGAADSAARLSDGMHPARDEAVAALVELRRAIRSIERLASLLERDPGALLRGRAFPTDR